MDVLSHQVATRFLEAKRFTIPRPGYLPKEVRDTAPIVPEGTDLAIWTWDEMGPAGKTVPHGIAFAGKADKPLWNYRFRSPEQRQQTIDETIRDRKSLIELKQKALQERRDYKHPFKEGDILNSSWGYDQTNVDFYQVVGVLDKMVLLREISKHEVNDSRVMPNPGHFIGPVLKKRPGTGGYVKITNSESASLWSGKPEYVTPFGMGH